MRVVPTRIHGIVDYLVGVLLISSPWIFGFADGDAKQWVPIIIGVFNIGVSLFTHYERGLVRAIPMPIHLGTDMGAGVVLVASPWLFGFANEIWWPHVIFGLMEVVFPLVTQQTPSDADVAWE